MSRLKCPELRRLPKSTKITAIQWRNQTPGALEPFFTSSHYPADQLVDPSHPGASLKKTKFPAILRDDLGMRMLPLGLLLREQRQFPAIPILTWRERVHKAREAGIYGIKSAKMPNLGRSTFQPGEQLYPKQDYNNTVLFSGNCIPLQPFLRMKLNKAKTRVPMSFHVATSKARMGSFRYQRKRLETRLRTALNLIVAKGAFHDTKEGNIGINMDDAGRKWVMQGWAYMFYPTTKINQMSYANLISLLRQLLRNLNAKAIQMENEWLNQSLLGEIVAEPKPMVHDARNWVIQHKRRLTFSQEHGSIRSKLSQLLEASRPRQTLHPKKRKLRKEPKPVDKEDVPMQNLAGKAPAVWKKELMSGLELLPGHRSSDSKKYPSKD